METSIQASQRSTVLVTGSTGFIGRPLVAALARAGYAVRGATRKNAAAFPADVERVKQPFSRGSAARSNASGAGGAGLGLAIVERIARMHGGRLELKPREGGGNVARVAIPVST